MQPLRGVAGGDGFGLAIVDGDEERATPVPHRYVHGYFDGTSTRFSVYLPPAETYGGRIVSFLQGGFGGSEHAAPMAGVLHVAIANGAVLVESNQGHVGNDLTGLGGDGSVLLWRATAASARFARDLAAEAYGSRPAYGYVIGGSGGASRTVACLEAAPDLFDGGVAWMLSHPGLFHFKWSLQAFVEPELRDRLPAIVGATEPGGSGDPYAALETESERRALTTLHRAGFPRGGEFLFGATPLFVLGLRSLLAVDPRYFEAFWTERGFEGSDGEESVTRRLVQEEVTVVRVVPAGEVPGFGSGFATGTDDVMVRMNALLVAGAYGPFDPVAIEVDRAIDPRRALGCRATVGAGGDGRGGILTGAIGKVVVAALTAPPAFSAVEPGDRLVLDNRDFVAFAHHHRHRVDPLFPGMAQFHVDGHPVFRPLPGPPLSTAPGATGRFDGKLILLQHTEDRECWPDNALMYADQVRAAGGQVDDHFRLWWITRAGHLTPATEAGRARQIRTQGAWSQALADVIAWVEDRKAPLPSTTYAVTPDVAVTLPATAAERGGIQAVVAATVNGASSATVAVGELVHLRARAEVPPGAGSVTAAAWDLDGTGSWAAPELSVDGTEASIVSVVEHAWSAPGIYPVTFRVTSNRHGSTDPAHPQVEALDRVRIAVVEVNGG